MPTQPSFELAAEIAEAVVDDREALESLADDIAEEIGEEIETVPELRMQIIKAAMATPDFKKILTGKIFDDD